MADDEQFSLCWNNFNSNLSAGFHESLCRGDLVDVTLAAEGQFVKAHRLVLSVCSPYFRKMFTQMPANQHAFVFLKDVSHTALKDLIQFMYCGEVNVKQEALPAFISTAEALQIKGLTDSDPPPPQTPPEPAAPTPPQLQQISSPRVRQRTSAQRTFKVETVDASIVDDAANNKQGTTQIVIQTTAAPSPATIVHHHQSQQQQPQQQAKQQIHHIQQTQQQQQITSAATTTTTLATTTTSKRAAQRSIGSSNAPHIKRTKSTIDPLETDTTTATTTTTTLQPQQITVQTAVVTTDADLRQQQQQQQTTTEREYIDLAIELPTKSEPDYADESGEVVGGDQDATYVEDDTYGDMRYDESYFTENEDAGQTTVSNTSAGGGGSGGGATTSKSIVKQQSSQSFSDSSYADAADQANSDAQDTELMFIESPWATPCLVLNEFMYNCHSRKNNKEYWRCHNYSKKIHAERCRSRLVLENGKLKTLSGGLHNHPPHSEKIEKMMQRNRLVMQNRSCNRNFKRIKLQRYGIATIETQELSPTPLPPTDPHLQTATIVTATHQALDLPEPDELIHTSLMLIHE